MKLFYFAVVLARAFAYGEWLLILIRPVLFFQMMDIAYSKLALRALRRMPPDLARQIRDRIAQEAAMAYSSPSTSSEAITRLEGAGWRAMRDAQGTVLTVVQSDPVADVNA